MSGTAKVRAGRLASSSAAMRAALLLGIALVFTVTTSGFWNAGNLYSAGQTFAVVGLIAGGLAVTMMVGEIDLSIAATTAVAGIVAIKLGGDAPLVGVLAALGVGVLIGTANGVLIVGLRVSSLVVTLGSLILLTGMAYRLAGGRAVAYDNFTAGPWLDQAVGQVLSPRSLIALGVLAVGAVLMRWTRYGRDVMAAGSSRHAALAAGVDVPRIVVGAFVVSALTASLAGALLAYSLATVPAGVDSSLLVQAASAAIVGGVALRGGRGTLGGVATGALVLVVLGNGLSLAGASTALVSLATGGVLLAFLVVDAAVGRRRAPRRAAPGAPRAPERLTA